MLEPQLFAWKMTEDDNMTEADNETTTLRLLGFSFQSFVSVPTAEHFNRVSNSVNIDMEIDTFPYSFWSNIPTYLNATSLSSFHGVLAPAYDFGRTTGDVPSSSTFFPLNGYPFSIPMTSLLAYIDTFSNEHWETIISNNSDYSEVRMIAPCGVIPGEAALWSKIDLSDPSSEANFTGNMRAKGIAGTLWGRTFPNLTITRNQNFKDGNDTFMEFSSPSLDWNVMGMGAFSATYTDPLFYYIGRPRAVTTGATAVTLMMPAFVYDAYEDELRAFCDMLNGKVSESLRRDEYYLGMFQQNGVNVETLPSWVYEKLESTYNDYLANDADEDFRVREEAMDLWYNSTGFIQYV